MRRERSQIGITILADLRFIECGPIIDCRALSDPALRCGKTSPKLELIHTKTASPASGLFHDGSTD